MAWKKIEEKEKIEIKKQAKKMMDNFMGALKTIEGKVISPEKRYEEQTRLEKKPLCEKEFKESWFKIAPKTKGNFLVAEKGSWIR